MSDTVKYRAVRFKKDQIAALYFTMSDIVHEYQVSTYAGYYNFVFFHPDPGTQN
jgi:hypothetical protein